MRKWSVLTLASLLTIAACTQESTTSSITSPQYNVATVTYAGNGFSFDGTTWNLNDERCGAEGQGTANDGSTGQFADWNGVGQPYQSGQPYLVWVLTANGATSATLHLPDGEVAMIKVGGTYKYASQYYTHDDLVNFPVHASYTGTARGNVTLVVSHGCKPFTTEGAWCSPGYWGRALDAAWQLIGVDQLSVTFGATVEVDPNFVTTDAARVANITTHLLKTVMTATGQPAAQLYKQGPVGTFYGWAANPFNLTGAWLTDQIPGFHFDPALADSENPDNEEACPIDHHGNFKLPS